MVVRLHDWGLGHGLVFRRSSTLVNALAVLSYEIFNSMFGALDAQIVVPPHHDDFAGPQITVSVVVPCSLRCYKCTRDCGSATASAADLHFQHGKH